MRVSKWGNSLALRLPATVVVALELKEGDEVEVSIVGTRRFKVSRDTSRDKALARLRSMKRALPKGFRFDRDAANER